MPSLPLRAFTQQLKDRWPNEAAALRLRRATRNGKIQYQLIGELPDRTPIGRKLRATTEFDALQEAIDLVPALMNGDGNRGRVMPMGRLKAIERLARQQGWPDEPFNGLDAELSRTIRDHYRTSNSKFCQRFWPEVQWDDLFPNHVCSGTSAPEPSRMLDEELKQLEALRDSLITDNVPAQSSKAQVG